MRKTVANLNDFCCYNSKDIHILLHKYNIGYSYMTQHIHIQYKYYTYRIQILDFYKYQYNNTTKSGNLDPDNTSLAGMNFEHNTTQHDTIRHDTIWHDTIRYGTKQIYTYHTNIMDTGYRYRYWTNTNTNTNTTTQQKSWNLTPDNTSLAGMNSEF